VQRVVAAALIDDGQTAAEAAIKAETSVGVARRWHKRLRTEASTADAPRSGRPPKTDAAADTAIVEQAKADPFLSNKQIRYKLKLPISSDTVGRRLDAAALPSRFAAKKRHYTDEQRRARLSFANGYKHWTAEQWERVIFSDEVTIEGEGRKRHVRVRRPDGHRFDPQYTLHSRIFTPSRHLFACFCSRGPGFCEMYEGKLDGKALRGLLERTVPETARDYYQTDPTKPNHEPWWLLHDNSPQFSSREVQRWLHNSAINVLDWPPYSPDLNPIENLWPRVHALMDRLCPTTDEAVADAFVECWPELSLDLFTDYAQSMPARIAAVIAANGDATQY
jgi:transposase